MKIIDFSNCKRTHASYGGSDRKFGVIYEGNVYMLKFSKKHARKSDIATSSVNNVISEYIGSKIAQSLGVPAHETVLGIHNGEVVVGCLDFRKNGETTIEFIEYVRAKYDSGDVGRSITLEQFYSSLGDEGNEIPDSLQEKSIERYWDTFIADALLGNFDRHPGNWGYLLKDGLLKLAPTYDYGSTLLPAISDEGASGLMRDDYEMFKRCLIFPSPSILIQSNKAGYYDLMASNYDENCTAAVLRIAPRIDMNKINKIVDATPLITEERKLFYKKTLSLRKRLIIDRAYIRCLQKDYDLSSLERLKNDRKFSEEDLNCFVSRYIESKRIFDANERSLLNKSLSDIAEKQIALIKEYGYKSNHLNEYIEALGLKQNICEQEVDMER